MASCGGSGLITFAGKASRMRSRRATEASWFAITSRRFPGFSRARRHTASTMSSSLCSAMAHVSMKDEVLMIRMGSGMTQVVLTP